jgi:hypothetical protein
VCREALGEADLIVDALLGTGIKGPVEGLLAAVIEDVNAWRNARSEPGPGHRVIAIDMPSGLPSGTEDFGGPIISADATVTFTAPKLGQLISPHAACVGTLVARAIGTPRELLDDDPTLKLHSLEPGVPDSPHGARVNKGRFGYVLIVAGSLGKSGAALLSGRGPCAGRRFNVATPPMLPDRCGRDAGADDGALLATEEGTASLRNLITTVSQAVASPLARARPFHE